jgi:hypothetical protein
MADVFTLYPEIKTNVLKRKTTVAGTTAEFYQAM